MNFFEDLFEKFYFLIKFLHVSCASSSSLFSSSSLYFKLSNTTWFCFATATGRLAQWPPSNTTWLICFATATARLAQWPPSNTTWLICFATATGQFDQTWRTVQNKPRSGWYTGSRSGTHFPQALINYTYETVQQHNKITYRSNSNKRAIKLVHQRTTTFSNVRQTAKHEAASFAQRNCDVIHQTASFAQRNCDVIQNGAEKMNARPADRSNEKTRVSFRLRAQETYAITGSPGD